jgi:hypothetical protein
MTKKRECYGCSWLQRRPDPSAGYELKDYFCWHPRWREIDAYVLPEDVMASCRCPMGRQRRCTKCGKMMKFIKNRPKYHGGEWGCNCEG